MSGALRGAGKQVWGAVINFICYYVFGLPLGICLALLLKLGVVGMWIGISVADTLQVIVELFTLKLVLFTYVTMILLV